MSKELEKKWASFIKSESRKNNWKFKGYFIFKIDGPFLFDAMFWIRGKTNSLKGVLHFKFAEIDALFLKVKRESNPVENYPLSTRVDGAGMVTPIIYYNFELKDITEAGLIGLLKTIDGKVAEIKEKFSAEEAYLSYIRENKVLNESSYLTNLLFCKKYTELIFFIEYCKQNNITSGMSFYKDGVSEDYFDRLTKYIQTLS